MKEKLSKVSFYTIVVVQVKWNFDEISERERVGRELRGSDQYFLWSHNIFIQSFEIFRYWGNFSAQIMISYCSVMYKEDISQKMQKKYLDDIFW